MTQTIERERAPEAAQEGAGEPNLIFGRPVEDRGFEAVEAGIGFAAGLAIGTAVAGPIGAFVGCLAGITGGIAAGEAVERAVGRAATTTNASDQEPPTTP
jgi:hypothetical protein